MRPRLAILLGAVVLAGACGEGPVVAPTPGPGPRSAASRSSELPALMMVRSPSTWRCEASAAPRPDDAAIEIVVQGEDGRILARGPAEKSLLFDLPPTTRGRISTIARYASGTERRRETVLP